jgi:hypothetical protein
LNKASTFTGTTIQNILNCYLGDVFNLFVVKCVITDQTTTGVVNVSVIYYKYIQRARVIKSRRMALLVAIGAFEIKSPIYYVRQSQGFVIPSNMISKLEGLLQSLFGKAFRVQFFNISQLAENSPNKLNANVIQAISYFVHNNLRNNAAKPIKSSWKVIESRLEKA